MEDYLKHFGILGMKWGVRRYRNKDGTLTEEGKRRYYDSNTKELTPKGKKAFFANGVAAVYSKAGRKMLKAEGEDSNIGRAARSEMFDRETNLWGGETVSSAASVFNSKLPSINRKWKPDKSTGRMPRGYYVDIGKAWKSALGDQLLRDFGEHPTKGKEWIKNFRLDDTYSYDMFDDVDKLMKFNVGEV